MTLPTAPVAAAPAAVLALTGCTSLSGTGDKGFVSGDGQLTGGPRRRPRAAGRPRRRGPRRRAARRWRTTAATPLVVVVWGAWCPPVPRPRRPTSSRQPRSSATRPSSWAQHPRPRHRRSAQASCGPSTCRTPRSTRPTARRCSPFSGVLTPNSIPSFVVLDERGPGRGQHHRRAAVDDDPGRADPRRRRRRPRRG